MENEPKLKDLVEQLLEARELQKDRSIILSSVQEAKAVADEQPCDIRNIRLIGLSRYTDVVVDLDEHDTRKVLELILSICEDKFAEACDHYRRFTITKGPIQ